MHDSLDGVPASRGDVSFEPGEQRRDDIHAVLPPLPANTKIQTMIPKYQSVVWRPKGHGRDVLVRPDDPFDDGVSDLVVDQPALGTADEELVLTENSGREAVD